MSRLSYFSLYNSFWQQNPALLYACAALIGIALALDGSWFYFVPLIFLFNNRLVLTLLTVIIFFGSVKFGYKLPDTPKEGIFGTAFFKIDSLSPTTTHFGKRWDYKGRIESFVPDNSREIIAYGIPCRLGIHDRENVIRPIANTAYRIHGNLTQVSKGNYILHIDKSEPWYAISKTFSFAEWRFQAKEALSNFIKMNIPNERSGEFLSGIATGNFEDRMMSFSFARFGVQHIMAISGFHFAILAVLLGMILRLIMPLKFAAIVLIAFTTAYMLFLGTAPSIMRAWLAVSLTLFGLLIHKRTSALNLLGVAILVILLFDPLLVMNLGFQLSTATTASILLFYAPFDRYLEKLFKTRSLNDAIRMHPLDQHAYVILTLARKALALEFAVNIVALPLSLLYFQKLPLLGFIWNLFFPFMVSISMLFLLMGLLLVMVPPLSQLVHRLNSHYTDMMLSVLYNPTTALDYQIYVTEFQTSYFVLYLSVIFAIGMRQNQVDENKLLKQNGFILRRS